MKNQYKIRDSYWGGIQFIKVWGCDFIYEDLYELVGQKQFITTFMFKSGSEAFNKFTQTVIGVIFYAKDEKEALDKVPKEGIDFKEQKIKIDSPMPELTQGQREDLKYGGIKIGDVESISFMPYKIEEEYHESGEKKVPNIIYIQLEDDPRLDYDILYQNYIASKINSKTELMPYEKEKFIGITLGIRNGRIDSRLLTFLGFDVERVKQCKNICYHVYKTKERRKIISDEEKAKLADLELNRYLENMIKLFTEIKRSGVNSEELSKSRAIFETIISSLSKFEPSILLHGKKQVYWDAESYLHIVLRHVKQLQMGNFKNKTSFPYKFEDLQVLIKKVLGSIGEEIGRYFEEKPGKLFRRHGKMSVLFNNDYYCMHIDKQGRLVRMYLNK